MKILKKISYNTPTILTFTIAAFIVTTFSHFTNGFLDKTFFSVYDASFLNPLTYVRLFGHVLGHASFEHFIGNFLIILLVGPMLEEKFGSKNLAYMILLTAGVTGIIYMLFFQDVALMGASGIAFMLILLSPFANVERGKIPLTLIVVVILYFGREIYSGMFDSDNIAQSAHLIGGICGAVFGYFLSNRANYRSAAK